MIQLLVIIALVVAVCFGQNEQETAPAVEELAPAVEELAPAVEELAPVYNGQTDSTGFDFAEGTTTEASTDADMVTDVTISAEMTPAVEERASGYSEQDGEQTDRVQFTEAAMQDSDTATDATTPAVEDAAFHPRKTGVDAPTDSAGNAPVEYSDSVKRDRRFVLRLTIPSIMELFIQPSPAFPGALEQVRNNQWPYNLTPVDSKLFKREIQVKSPWTKVLKPSFAARSPSERQIAMEKVSGVQY